MPRLLASCWFLAYLWHFKLSGAPVFLIMPIQILGSRKPNREVRSTLEFSLNLFQVEEEAMCRMKPRESINVAVSSSRGEGSEAEDEGVSPGGQRDGIGWYINQRLRTISAEKSERARDRWITSCSKNFKLKQWYIFRLNLLCSFIKHLADKENQQHKPAYAVKNSYSFYWHLHSIVFTFVLHISEIVYNHKCVQGAEVGALSLFILLIHKLGPEGAAFQTGKPPAAASSSLPTCQSEFSPGPHQVCPGVELILAVSPFFHP